MLEESGAREEELKNRKTRIAQFYTVMGDSAQEKLNIPPQPRFWRDITDSGRDGLVLRYPAHAA